MSYIKKTSRYHIDVLFPDFTDESFKKFYETVYSTGALTFSAHSVVKIVNCVQEYGKMFLTELDFILKNGPIEKDGLFEFYADKHNEIIKCCFRHSSKNLPVDVVLVVSNTATVITIYVIDKGDFHALLNKNLYVRKERRSV